MSSRSRPIGFAIIGAGMAATPHFAALRELAESGAARAVSVFSRDVARRETAARTLDARVAESVGEIASDAEVDAVLLLTPPDARREIVKIMAAAGKPILMEKPVERTLAAATALVETMEGASLPLGIVLQHRLKPAARRLSRLLADGELGDPALVRVEVPWWRDQSYYNEPGRGTFARDGGGVLISQAIHALDLMLSLVGPVIGVQAMMGTTRLHRMEAEDFATAGLSFASGAAGCVMATTASYPGGSEIITIVCEDATAVLAGSRLRVTWRNGKVETAGDERGSGGGSDPMAFDHGPHREVLADFADALATGGSPVITGRSALAVHRLIEAMTRSSDTGRRISLATD